MSVPIVALFNCKSGVGTTSLVYHIAWMLADLDYRVLAADLDPQGSLSAAFLEEDRLEQLWPEDTPPATIYGAIEPLKRGIGDIAEPTVENLNWSLGLVPGDMSLSGIEEDLSQAWQGCLDGDERSFRIVSAFWRVLQQAAQRQNADIVLMDLGPNLGAINRAALIAADYVVIPLGVDLFSIQGLHNLGPRVGTWRKEWSERLPKNPDRNLALPAGAMYPLGYVVMQHPERFNRIVNSYQKWIAQIPGAYRHYVLAEERPDAAASVKADSNCLAVLKNYRSLVPMAQEARKPIFHLKPGDGALGAHLTAMKDAYADFKNLALAIVERAGIRSTSASAAALNQ